MTLGSVPALWRLVSRRPRRHLTSWGSRTAPGPGAPAPRGEKPSCMASSSGVTSPRLAARAGAARLAGVGPDGASTMRRFTARVGNVDLARMSSRPPAPVSHNAPSGASASTPRAVARRVTVDVRLTCERRCIWSHVPIPGASVQATDRPRSRSCIHTDPLPEASQGPGHHAVASGTLTSSRCSAQKAKAMTRSHRATRGSAHSASSGGPPARPESQRGS